MCTIISTINFICLLALQQTHAFSVESNTYDPNMKTKIASSVAKTERREIERARVGREICQRCIRPPELCVCESLPDQLIDTSTRVLILQHPRERRRKSLSTVPLMPLVLKKCIVKTGYNFTPNQLDLVTDCIDRGQKPLLLFPGVDAISLDDDRAGSKVVERLQSEKQLLILLDGTWSEANRMRMQSPELMSVCQQVQFKSESESIYPDSLRKEPEKHCLSTLESCGQALMYLEPSIESAQRAKQTLEGAMRCMVEKRISVSESRERNPRWQGYEPKKRIYDKNKQRNEIKKQLFS